MMNLMQWRYVRTNVMVAGRGSAAQIMIFSALCLGDHAHEVSILIAMIGPAGRYRGVEPRSKTSMMIMRPPQHGQRCEGGVSLSSLLLVVSPWDFCLPSSWRARAMLSAQAALANRP